MTRLIIDILHKQTLEENKIPNLKHQITNKSQFPILNDQNSHQNFIVSLQEPNAKGMVPMATTLDGSIVWSAAGGLVLGIYLIFGFWCLEFPVTGIPKIQRESHRGACGRWPARDR